MCVYLSAGGIAVSSSSTVGVDGTNYFHENTATYDGGNTRARNLTVEAEVLVPLGKHTESCCIQPFVFVVVNVAR